MREIKIYDMLEKCKHCNYLNADADTGLCVVCEKT